MATICAVCQRKQSGWIQDFALPDAKDNQRICFNCNTKLEMLSRSDSIENTSDAVDFFIECLSKGVSAEATNYVQSVITNLNQRIKEKEETIAAREEDLRIEQEAIESKKQQIIEEELNRQSYAKSFHEFYEYDVVTIINKGHGQVDKSQMMQVLTDHAQKGWKLHTIYSNELGKNALYLLGLGVNSTACEDVLIFERRVERL